MSSKALQDVLGFLPLTETLRTLASGVPDPFPPEFSQVLPQHRIIGDKAKYIRISGERRTSKLAKYGSPARRRTLRDVGDATVKCLHTFEEYQIDPTILMSLRSFEQYEQDKGLDWLRYQNEEAAKRYQNTRTIGKASVLANGALYWDVDGNLLPSSSNAFETYSFGVPATHQNQINGNITVSWASHTADILGDIRRVKQYSRQETGLEIEAALYGINVPKYIQQNDYSSAYLSRNATMNEKMMISGEIPDGFGDIKKWYPVYNTFYESDDAGTVSTIWNNDMVCFVPNVTQPDKMTWWAQFEGSFPVPISIDVLPGGDAMNNFRIEYGMFAYALPSANPPGFTVFHGDTELPAIRNEKAIYQAIVAF